jgi:formylglycine-generating enzyme required for sulfatase activity
MYIAFLRKMRYAKICWNSYSVKLFISRHDRPYQNSIDLLVNTNEDYQARMLRGGSWFLSPWICRSAFRYYDAPDIDFNVLGFRVVYIAAWT